MLAEITEFAFLRYQNIVTCLLSQAVQANFHVLHFDIFPTVSDATAFYMPKVKRVRRNSETLKTRLKIVLIKSYSIIVFGKLKSLLCT